MCVISNRSRALTWWALVHTQVHIRMRTHTHTHLTYRSTAALCIQTFRREGGRIAGRRCLWIQARGIRWRHTGGEVRLKNTKIREIPERQNDKRFMPRCRAKDKKRTKKKITQSGKELNGDSREKIFEKGGQRKRDERHNWSKAKSGRGGSCSPFH